MNNTLKKFGRKKSGCWGRPRKGNKKISNKAVRKFKLKEDYEIEGESLEDYEKIVSDNELKLLIIYNWKSGRSLNEESQTFLRINYNNLFQHYRDFERSSLMVTHLIEEMLKE